MKVWKIAGFKNLDQILCRNRVVLDGELAVLLQRR